MDLKAYLKARKDLIDEFFHSYFRDDVRPPVLREAMLYSLFAGGKRIRPILALASYEACGGDPRDIVPYASSLELIHTYSLIHDDLPAMDDDDLRRGKPTSHKVYGEAIAILAGDALITEAFGILSDPGLFSGVKEANLMRVCREISIASGCRGMVAGQVQDMLSTDADPDAETLYFIHMHKTAALISASVKFGPLICGSDAGVLDSLSGYGEKIGLAFQVVDDILDVEGTTEEIGKPAGSDERINKMTYPRLYGVGKSREIAEQLVSEAVLHLDNFSSEADPLREIAYYLIRRTS